VLALHSPRIRNIHINTQVFYYILFFIFLLFMPTCTAVVTVKAALAIMEASGATFTYVYHARAQVRGCLTGAGVVVAYAPMLIRPANTFFTKIVAATFMVQCSAFRGVFDTTRTRMIH
jgi:hypothetical protein